MTDPEPQYFQVGELVRLVSIAHSHLNGEYTVLHVRRLDASLEFRCPIDGMRTRCGNGEPNELVYFLNGLGDASIGQELLRKIYPPADQSFTSMLADLTEPQTIGDLIRQQVEAQDD